MLHQNLLWHSFVIVNLLASKQVANISYTKKSEHINIIVTLKIINFNASFFFHHQVAKCYFAQIVHAISYCHQLHVVHRDLKPENVVFFEKQGVVKLTDFGFSNRFQPGKKLNTSCGSLAYSAPEILLGDEYDAPAVGKSDIL